MEQSRSKLPDLISAVDQEMQRLNYKKDTIDSYRRVWKKLLVYAKGKDAEYFSVDFGDQFIREEYGIDVMASEENLTIPKWKIKMAKRVTYVLGDYQNTGVLTRKNRTNRIEIPGCFYEIAEHFKQMCRNRYNSESTIESKMFTVKQFLLFLEQMGANDISTLNGEYISGFTKTIVGWSQRTIGSSLATLRQFLIFLYQEQYLPVDLTVNMPHVNCGRAAKLPTIWSPDEVIRVLNAIDRATPEGKRDYAIFLLVTHLGLRAGDVRNLKFENIHWKDCCLRLIQMKTRVPLELPLSEEIGNAIIDYLKYGRPKQDTSSFVFVRHTAPYGNCLYYYHAMRKYLSKAGVKIDYTKPHGLHSLRHTLATRLLEQKVPLQTISQILGHTSVNSTSVYLRVDLEGLRQCALNPEEVFVNDEL